MKCPICGTECADSSRFCNMCGASITANKVETVVVNAAKPAPKPAVTFDPKKIRLIVRNAVLALVAFILFLTSFMPVLRMNIGKMGNDKMEGLYYDISPLDTIILFGCSLTALDKEELQDSDLYEKYEDIMDDLYDIDEDEYKDFSKEEKKTVQTLIKTLHQLALTSDEAVTGVSLTLVASLSVVYIIFSALAFLISLLSLLAHFTGKKTSFPVAVRLTTATAMMLPALYYLIRGILGENSYGDIYEFSAQAILSIVLVGALAVYCIIERIILARNTISIKRYVVNATVMLLCVVMLALSFSPVVGITADVLLEGKTSEKKVTVDVGMPMYTQFETTEGHIENAYDRMGEGKEARQTYIANITSEFKWYTLREVKDGHANYIASSVFNYTTIYKFNPSIVKFFAMVQLLSCALVILTVVLIARTLNFFILGDKKRGSDIALASVAIGMAVLVFVALSLHVGVVNDVLDVCDIKSRDLSAHVCTAPIVMMVLAVAAMVATCFDKARKVVLYTLEPDDGDASAGAAEEPATAWTCACGTENPGSAKYCTDCFKPRA